MLMIVFNFITTNYKKHNELLFIVKLVEKVKAVEERGVEKLFCDYL